MQLVRLAVINLDSKQKEPISDGVFASDDGVKVQVTSVSDPVGARVATQLIPKATIALGTADCDAERYIVIPSEPRLWCEWQSRALPTSTACLFVAVELFFLRLPPQR
jgi:hypothetical protein